MTISKSTDGGGFGESGLGSGSGSAGFGCESVLMSGSKEDFRGVDLGLEDIGLRLELGLVALVLATLVLDLPERDARAGVLTDSYAISSSSSSIWLFMGASGCELPYPFVAPLKGSEDVGCCLL